MSNENRFIRFSGAIANDCVLDAIEGEEAVTAIFRYDITFRSTLSSSEMRRYLNQPVCCVIGDEHGHHRCIHGHLMEIHEYSGQDNAHSYSGVIRPALESLNHGCNLRVWEHLSASEIVLQLLNEHHIQSVEDKLYREHTRREFCLQYRESDLAFMLRLLEDDGIFFYFKHEKERHTLVLADHYSVYSSAVALDMPFIPKAGSQTPHGIESWKSNSSLTASSFMFKGYNPAQASSISGKALAAENTHVIDTVHYVDTGAAEDPERLEFQAQRQAERQSSQTQTFSCDARAFWFKPGDKINLTDHPTDNGTYIVFRSHLAADNISMTTSLSHIELFPHDQPWLPKSAASKPYIPGVLSATVAGPDSEEIITDKFGRIQICFPFAEGTPLWARCVQPWIGNGYGWQFIPRIGSQVLVSFINGDPDIPVVTGALANGTNRPPFSLPENSALSGIKTHSTPGGEQTEGHVLSFLDTKGKEELRMCSQRDLFLGANHEMEIHSKSQITLAAGSGYRVEIEEGDFDISVLKGHSKQNITGGDHQLRVNGGGSHIRTDKLCVIESTESIELRVGANQLSINASGITIQANMLTLKGNNSVTVESSGTTTIDGSLVFIG